MVLLSGIALIATAACLVRNRISTTARISINAPHAAAPATDSEEQFRQRIRSIVHKVAADIKKEQASAHTTSNHNNAAL
jgi:hypothetical protein